MTKKLTIFVLSFAVLVMFFGIISSNNLPKNSKVKAEVLVNESCNDTEVADQPVLMKENSKTKYRVNVLDYGAVGDGVNDDTCSILRAIKAIEDANDDNGTNRFNSGYTLFFPEGTYRITKTIKITESNIRIEGANSSNTILYAKDATFDLVNFDGTKQALYGSGISNIKIYSPNTTTSGVALQFINIINSINENVEISGSYDGLRVSGGGKLYFHDFLLTQTNRTQGLEIGKSLILDGKVGVPSDIHFTNLQIVPNKDNQPYTVLFESGDGVFFTSCHFHGGVLFRPDAKGVLASFFFSNTYFDSALDALVLFEGSADSYRNFMFSNVYFRDAKDGVRINTTGVISNISLSNAKMSEMSAFGINTVTERLVDSIFSNIIFSNNNEENSITQGDILLMGYGNIISNTIHQNKNSNSGYAILLHQFSSGNTVETVVTSRSNYKQLIINNGLDNVIRK